MICNMKFKQMLTVNLARFELLYFQKYFLLFYEKYKYEMINCLTLGIGNKYKKFGL